MKRREPCLFKGDADYPYRIGWTFDELLDEAIDVIRKNEPPEGYYGGFSGGKDSVMLKEVARMAGVKVRWRYNVTTIDPPELIYFMREHHPDVEFLKPEAGNFFAYGANCAGFPTRRARWCCRVYKEGKEPKGSTVLVGVRAEESHTRRSRYQGFVNKPNNITLVAPLFHIDSEDLWAFIKGRCIPYCSLYDEGFHRLGCVGCPMGGTKGRKQDFKRWPRFERLWKRMFRHLWERKAIDPEWFGCRHFNGWEEMWDWWLNDKPLPKSK